MVLSSFIARFCAATPLLGLLAASCRAAPTSDSVASLSRTINTPHGKVAGAVSASSLPRYSLFLSAFTSLTFSFYAGDNVVRYTVPYAQPPLGAQRWKAASNIGPWSNVDGTKLPPPCTQYDSSDNIIGSEDCLFLKCARFPSSLGPTKLEKADLLFGARSVYAPADAGSNAALPVMVWLHGGSFLQGSQSDLDEGARSLVRQERVVVVTVQYRLGILGFLGWFGSNGNQGLTDVMQALSACSLPPASGLEPLVATVSVPG